jgi:hypothetical protein
LDGTSALITSLNGAVTVTGVGGNGSSNSNHGTYVDGGQIASTGSATLTITGTGGNGTSTNYGVLVNGTNALITSLNGAVTVTGVGGNGSSHSNHGTVLQSGGQITSTGSATLTINGTGGNGTEYNHGVYVAGTDALITSATGAVNVTGVGGGNGTGSSNYGTLLEYGGQITSNALGNAIILVSGTGGFFNNSGSSALSTPNGRWLVYSTNHTVGGLSNSFRRFSCTYGGSCPSFPATGNGLLYSFTPTLTITPTALASALTYGDAAPNLVGYAYGASGYLGSDATADTLSGSLTGTTSYTQGSNVGTYNINYSSGSLTSAMGYGFTYANNASAITVGKRSLGGVVNNQTLTYGAATPSYGKNDVTWNAGDFYGSDDVASLTSATIDNGGYAQGSNAGSYTLAATGLSATNYQLGSVTPGILTVTGGTTDGDILPRPSVPNTVQWVTQNTFMMPTGSVDNAELMFTNQANDNQSTISSNGNSDDLTMAPDNDNKKSKISYDALLMLNIDPILAQNLGIKREFLKRFTMPGRKTQLNHNNLSETILAWAS